MNLNKLYKVLILLIPCIIITSCSKKNNFRKIHTLNFSKSKISKLNYHFDTLVDYFEYLGKNSISVINKNGVILNYSFTKGVLIASKNKQYDTIMFAPFNNGALKSNIIHSKIVNDSIVFFFNDHELWCFDVLKNKFSKIFDLKNKIKSPNNFLFHIEQYTYNQSPSIQYDEINNTIYFPIFTYSKKEKKYFIGVMNLNNNKISVLDLVRPNIDEIIQQSIQDHTMFILENNKIYFAFAFWKLGLTYDLKTKLIDTVNIQSTFDTIPQMAYTQKNTNIRSAQERLVKTLIYNAYYQNFTFNLSKKHFYKLFYKKLDEDNANGLKNTLEDKRLMLQIFDIRLQLIKEFEIPIGFSHAFIVLPTETGLELINGYNIPNKLLKLTIRYD